MSRVDYSPLVRGRFNRLAHAAQPGEAADASGSAGRSERGAAVELLAWCDGRGRLARVRFRAYGCPALLAAADLAAESLEGQPSAALGRIDPRALASALELPAGKLGRVLLIEDAGKACLAALPQSHGT